MLHMAEGGEPNLHMSEGGELNVAYVCERGI